MDKKIEIILIIVVVLFLIIIMIRNEIIRKQKRVERSKSLIDVFLKKRFDLIPNLVEVCKGYSKFEKETFEEITKLRSNFNSNPNEDNISKLSKEYQKLIALVESYPTLKASENYLKLQKEMVDVEGEIQAARRIYINNITSYNNYITVFPNSLIANICGYKEMALPQYQYEEVKIDFKK